MNPARTADPAVPSPDAATGGGGLRGPAATCIVAGAIALGVFVACFALSLLGLRTDRAALVRPVVAAFADGSLDRRASWLHGDTGIGAHQYNDCLILFQSLDDRAPAMARAVSPLSVPVDTDNACGVLADVAGGTAPPPRHYHQYLHAHTTLARLLVPTLGVGGLRGFYKLALTLVLLAGAGYALLGVIRGRRMAEHAAWLAVFGVFSRWFGLESFGQSLGHAPADLVLLGFLLFLLRASAATPLSARTAVVAAAVFGALTMQFEFLTGGLPLGLAVVIGALPLALPGRWDSGVVVLRSVVAYGAAAIATALAKLAMVVALFGPATLIDIGHQFLFRTGAGSALRRASPVGGYEFATHVFAGLNALAAGMPFLAFGIVLLAMAAGGWGYARLRDAADGGTRLRAVALLGSAIVPPLWLVIFWQHSAEHAWFMDRILVWIIAAGAALFVLALADRGRASPSHA